MRLSLMYAKTAHFMIGSDAYLVSGFCQRYDGYCAEAESEARQGVHLDHLLRDLHPSFLVLRKPKQGRECARCYQQAHGPHGCADVDGS